MNRNRILCRLRSKHARRSFQKGGKLPWIPRILEALNVVTSLGHSKVVPPSTWRSICSHVRDLETCFQRLEKLARSELESDHGTHILSELLHSAHALSLFSGFVDVVKKVERLHPFSPGIGSAWLEMLGKLGRYTTVPTFLVATARKVSLFKKIEIKVVPPEIFVAMPKGPTNKTFIEVLGRTMPSDSPSGLLTKARACTAHAEKITTSAASIYQAKLREARKTRSVHAEVKLVFFYEDHQTGNLWPRAIRSNKSPCVLCWLLMKRHGRYDIKESHGRLYILWTLPRVNGYGQSTEKPFDLQEIVAGMNQDLEQRIRNILNKGRPKQIHPNESRLHVSSPWASSAGSLVEAFPARDTDLSMSSISGSHKSIGKGLEVDATLPGQLHHSRRSLENEGSSLQPMCGAEMLDVRDSSIQAQMTAANFASQALPVDTLQSDPSCGSRSTQSLSIFPRNEKGGHLQGESVAIARRWTSSPTVGVYTSDWLYQVGDLGAATHNGCAPLVQGRSVCRELHRSFSVIRISTPHIDLSLSTDSLWSQSDDQIAARKDDGFRGSHSPCMVIVKWMTAEEHRKMLSEQRNIVDLSSGHGLSYQVFEDGAAKSPSDLYIAHKTDLVRIKYSVGAQWESW